MKEDVKIFYLAKCKVLDGKINTTRAYKYGVSDQSFQQRGIKTEFSKFLNANPKTNATHLMQDGNKLDVEANPELIIQGPKSFIDDLEYYVKNDYFLNDEKFFTTKEEYINMYEESHDRFVKLVEVLKKHEPQLAKLLLAYGEIDTSKSNQNNLLALQKELYSKILEDIKKELKAFSSSKIIPQVTQVLQIAVPPVAPSVPNAQKKDVYTSLLTEFKLYKDGSKYYLQHNDYHKGKDPTDYRGAFTVDLSNPNSEKFQWGQNSEFKKYGYKYTQASAQRVIKIFANAGQIVDLTKSPTYVSAPPTNGLNHSSNGMTPNPVIVP